MLRTCNRCKRRRVKCDTQLPACANCVKSSSQCTFKDLDRDVPRAYVKSLYDKIEKLEAQLNNGQNNLLSPVIPSHLHPSSPRPFSFNEPPDTFNSSPFYIEQLPVAQAVSITLRLLTPTKKSVDSNPQSEPPKVEVPSFVGRDVITPQMLNSLLQHYTATIFPAYPLPLVYEHISDEPQELGSMPVAEKFHILMACALAALHRSHSLAEWSVVARICREWAGELAVIMCKRPTQEALIAAVALLVYETIDPSRGMIWILYDWAMRQCLQLGWHSFQDPGERPSVQSPETASPLVSSSISARTQTLSVLQQIQISLKFTFNRPSMLDTLILSKSAETIPALQLHAKVLKILETTEHCIFSEEFTLPEQITELPSTEDSALHDLWLMLYPNIIDHKHCPTCTDDQVKSFQGRLLWAAFVIINSTHQDVVKERGLVSPVFAAIRILNAGCVLAIAKHRQLDQTKSSLEYFNKVTEVLTVCSIRWVQGAYYSNIWRVICTNVSELEYEMVYESE